METHRIQTDLYPLHSQLAGMQMPLSSQFVGTLSSDVVATSVLALVLSLGRYAFQSFVQRYVVQHAIVGKEKSLKFSESAWKFLYYAVAWSWCAMITLNSDFFWNPSLCIEGWPGHPNPEPSMKWFYIFQLSFYVSSMFLHVTFEVRRKDFVQMLLHHVLSAGLIGMSYYMNLYRFGAVLLFLHDVNDIILESGKMLIYAGYSKVADGLFVSLICTWFATRLVLFPMKVLYTSSVTAYPIAISNGNWTEYLVINFMLFSIQALNLMWFGMMIRLLMRVVLKKENVTDSREEHDEHDSKEELKVKQQEHLQAD
eukprot:TRINITY_DN8650_c0_g1_i1.p1 TRINITY_DN8650_c0_g1~~TRINITY_DN8650_c0_g1_i1.p1  ORF type:complete len:312 (+),score=63.66 TRINITY_DN8650_c0_g1_i1:117-1052(+)